MWTYDQSSGDLADTNGEVVSTGYSGYGSDKNAPAFENITDLGPIPVGSYTINAPEDTATHGPYVLPLTPDEDNNMFGRSGFLIHGDSKEHPGAASHGCIVVGRLAREAVWSSGDRKLTVVSGISTNVMESLED